MSTPEAVLQKAGSSRVLPGAGGARHDAPATVRRGGPAPQPRKAEARKPAWARNHPLPRADIVPQVITAVPAIAADEQSRSISRRAVSWRWLGAVTLVGLLGLALIAFALFVSLDGELDVVEAPRAAFTGGGGTEALPRGDALASRSTVVGAKRAFRASYGHASGGRETLVSARFTRLSTRLLPNSVGLEDEVPPLKQGDLIREEGAHEEALEPIDPSEQDGPADVSTVFSPLPEEIPEGGPVLPEAAAQRQAQAAAEAARSMGPTATFSPQSALGRSMLAATTAVQPQDTPFTSMDVRIVPENITEITRQDGGRSTRRPVVAVDVAPGEALAGPLRQAGAGDKDADGFAQALGRVAGRSPGTLTAEFEDGLEGRKLARVTWREGDKVLAAVARNDNGGIVPVFTPDPAYGVGSGLLQKLSRDLNTDSGEDGEDQRPEATSLYESFYQTALLNDVPKDMIDEVLRLFAFDVDLERAVGPNDRIDLLAIDDPEGHGHSTLLYAALELGRETIAYWRTTNAAGQTVFVDQEGRSNKRMLVSKPITEARLTSGFGIRYHPVLHYTRPHNGIDWANRIGTPVFAAGDGEVIEAGWHSGYGRHVEIRHADGFVTTYSHLSALAKGLAPGMHVRLGQTIGALGQSGLATGPHLHFEVKLNGTFVNPLTVRIPRAFRLDQASMEQFHREQGQLDRILACSDHGTCQGPA